MNCMHREEIRYNKVKEGLDTHQQMGGDIIDRWHAFMHRR